MDAYTLRRKFPHLLPKEKLIWNKFLDVHQNEYESFDYDIHVGVGVELPKDVSPMIRKIALGLTRKRIDVIGYKPKSITIFEIKPDAGLSAVGQCLAYYYLYKREYKPKRTVFMRIVSTTVNRDTKSVAKAYGIFWVYVKIDWTKYQYDPVQRVYKPKSKSAIIW